MPVGLPVGLSVGLSVGVSVVPSVGVSLARVGGRVRGRVGEAVGGRVRGGVGEAVGRGVGRTVGGRVGRSGGRGIHGAPVGVGDRAPGRPVGDVRAAAPTNDPGRDEHSGTDRRDDGRGGADDGERAHGACDSPGSGPGTRSGTGAGSSPCAGTVAGDGVAGPADDTEDAGLGGHARGPSQVGGTCRAEQQRGEDGGEVRVDLGELEIDRHALAAFVEVGLDLAGVALGDALADVGADVLVRPATLVLVELLGVHVQERLPQALARAIGERGHRVGAHAEQLGDLGGLGALHLGVPQHQLPALGQRRERLRRSGVLEALDRGVAEGDPRVERLHVVGGGEPRGRTDAVDVQTAYGRQQVGAEGDVGAAAALEHHEDLGESIGDQVVDIAM